MFKPGDKVQATCEIVDFNVDEKITIPKGTVGKVTRVWLAYHDFTMYPYDVAFEGVDDFLFYVSRDEVEKVKLPSRWRRFLDKYFPTRDAEKHFGTDKTVEAFHNVKNAVSTEGE